MVASLLEMHCTMITASALAVLSKSKPRCFAQLPGKYRSGSDQRSATTRTDQAAAVLHTETDPVDVELVQAGRSSTVTYSGSSSMRSKPASIVLAPSLIHARIASRSHLDSCF